MLLTETSTSSELIMTFPPVRYIYHFVARNAGSVMGNNYNYNYSFPLCYVRYVYYLLDISHTTQGETINHQAPN